MATLEFQGPFHYDEIDKSTGKINKNRKSWNLNKAGIYIWGFMYKYDQSGITDIVTFDESEQIKYNPLKMKFIPYYVGLKKDEIFKRLSQHHNIRNGFAANYTRLGYEYMKQFFMDKYPEDPKNPNFPIHFSWPKYTSIYTEKMNNIIKLKRENFIYFNNHEALKNIYPDASPVNIGKGVKPDYRIYDQIAFIDENNDTLYQIIRKKNNFWFCYSERTAETPPEITFEDCEAFTFFSLKGKTISRTKNLPIKDLKIVDKTETSIFKSKPSAEFNGDY